MAGIATTLVFAFHIASGAIAMAAGSVALAARKGRRVHRRAGAVFVAAMLVMAVSAAILGAIRPGQTINIFIAALTLYLVATAWLTVRRAEGAAGGADRIAPAVSALLCAPFALIDFQVISGVTIFKSAFKIEGPILIALGVFSAIMVIAVVGDLKAALRGVPRGVSRIARHLWRMGFALALSFGSGFTNGLARLLPGPYHAPPLFFAPQLAVLAVMLFWAGRVRFAGWDGPAAPLN